MINGVNNRYEIDNMSKVIHNKGNKENEQNQQKRYTKLKKIAAKSNSTEGKNNTEYILNEWTSNIRK